MENLNESSLSRLYKKMTEHDCGMISAQRAKENCGKGKDVTKADNKKRTRSLQSKLSDKRYGTTKVRGSYIENYGSEDEIEVGETVFFVEDMDDKGNLLKDLKSLGEEFEQDSILFIPKGGKGAELWGTNECPNGYPGMGKKIKMGERALGTRGEFFTKVRGRPFVFKEMVELELPMNYMSRWACRLISEKHWSELEDD